MNVSLTKKMFLLLVLALLMWVPLLMIENTVSERAGRRDSVQQEVADSLAGEQQILGPLLEVPYTYLVNETVVVGNGKEAHEENRIVKHADTLQVMPRNLVVTTTLTPVILERGIFRAVTYQSDTVLEGEFHFPARLPEHAREALWGEANLALGVQDVRGLSTRPTLDWNQISYPFQPGIDNGPAETGVHAPLGLISTDPDKPQHFSIHLTLRGTKRFYVLPMAQQFQFDLKSEWPHPSFIGNFLPETRSITDKGFTASWRLTDFATHARQMESCNGDGGTCGSYLSSDRFGVALIDPVDNYLQAERAVKYGFLFIILTFSAVFLTETLRRQAVHPIQYLLTGVALALFFLLVLAFSEHVSFAMAYVIASVACVSLNGFYLGFALAHRMAGISAGGLLAVLYGVMYQLLLSEDAALLLGSSLLFGLLAIAMFITRRVDWYALTSKTATNAVGRQVAPATATAT